MKNKLFFLFCCSALLLGGCGGSAEPADQASYGAVETTCLTVDSAETKEFSAYSATAVETQMETQANVVVDGMNYFTFHASTKIYQDEDGQDLLLQMLTDPDFYSPDTGLYDWVNGILDDLYRSEQKIGQDLLTYAEEEQKSSGEDFYSFAHYLTLGVGRHDRKVASVLALSSMNSGGPYPSTVQTARNLDMQELKVLTLEDVLEENSTEQVFQLVLAGVQEKFALVGEGGLYSDYQTVIKNALNYGNMTSHWYFNEEGLVVFFNQYELAPHAAGIIKTVLPYDALDGILKPEYIPEKYIGTARKAIASKTAFGSEDVCTVSFGEGETLFVSLAGKASHVQLSEVFFAENTPVGESMLFSANFVEEGTTFAVQGDWTDQETIYGLQYSDETGGPYVLYLTSAEAWAEVP